ncbi:metallophosphoesterase [uncultured Intestinimonas sp.]|uniref:metallophosphoesterase n=1 Tax=uncultured Intestinimonas sp. TaxID=1689265 RepID=UPI0025D04C55|nr:metallophosphoesterase [uncultured Intestinimonas sp.]
MKQKKRWIILAAACAAAAVTAAAGLDQELVTRTYSISTEKLSQPIRLALLTDLHSCAYGPGQRDLLDAVDAAHPDLVLLGGDILDDDPTLDAENAWTVLRTLGEAYPTFYVTGNHEFWSGRAEDWKEQITTLGVTVLEGDCATVVLQGQPLNLCGVDDPAAGEAVWEAQLQRAAGAADPAYFTILLSHRPERVEDYQGKGFDLVLAGHAHGGQWRIPGVLNGLLAPDQGLLPAYAGGLYALEDTTLVVSRGLARESTRVPRLFNPPELVILDVIPAR